MGKYITEYERYKIEGWLECGLPVAKIADNLGKCTKTIYNEIKRGTVELIDTHLKPYKKYLADYAQRQYEEKRKYKGRKTNISENKSLYEYIRFMLHDQRLSPYAVSENLKQSGIDNVCEKTIYNYVHSGLIPGVTIQDLSYSRRKQVKHKIKRIPKNYSMKKTLIEDRPAYISDRKEYGHWEMDTVYSGRNRGKACLLVLSERMTREEIIIKLKDRKAESVVAALDQLERQIGKKRFRSQFRSITCDNGIEFSDIAGITRNDRTTLYFCHAYASAERGTNENQNKLIRRFIPKGRDIGKYTKKQIQEIQDWMNILPRKLFGGLSAYEYKNLIAINNCN